MNATRDDERSEEPGNVERSEEPGNVERSEEPGNVERSEEAVADLGFTWRATKAGEVVVARDGRAVTTLRGRTAATFLLASEQLEPAQVQQRLARLTGNYARGNERAAKKHPRNR